MADLSGSNYESNEQVFLSRDLSFKSFFTHPNTRYKPPPPFHPLAISQISSCGEKAYLYTLL